MYLISAETTNRQDWIFFLQAVDADTGEDVDLTGALIVVAVADQDGCQRLYGSTDDGIVTLPTTSVIKVWFVNASMKALCAATYLIGVTITINGETVEPLTGSVNITGGIVP